MGFLLRGWTATTRKEFSDAGWGALVLTAGMALLAGALVLGSATPPVTEMIEHEKNGLLYDFFDVKGLASSAIEALDRHERFAPMREAARRTIVERYDLATRCLPEWLSLIDASAGAKTAERT